MNATIDTLDAEIARLQVEIGSVEQAPPTIAERFAVVEAQLRDAEALYQTHGLRVSAGHPAEHAYLQRQALIGLCMTVGSDKILKTERARIEQQGEGMTAADKARRLQQLRGQILRAAARRELAVREVEGDGFMPRPVHAELAVFGRTAVQALAR